MRACVRMSPRIYPEGGTRTDEGAAGFVALIYAETGAVYYRYRWMCACVKLETQTSVHANLTRPSASARYSPSPADKEGTLLSSPLTRPTHPTRWPPRQPAYKPLPLLPCPSLFLSFRRLNPFRIISTEKEEKFAEERGGRSWVLEGKRVQLLIV